MVTAVIQVRYDSDSTQGGDSGVSKMHSGYTLKVDLGLPWWSSG